jgi:hypothetical protein
MLFSCASFLQVNLFQDHGHFEGARIELKDTTADQSFSQALLDRNSLSGALLRFVCQQITQDFGWTIHDSRNDLLASFNAAPVSEVESLNDALFDVMGHWVRLVVCKICSRSI